MLVPRGICFLVLFLVFIWNVLKWMLYSIYSDKFEKYSHFETFHIKTQNNTENCIPLGTNITNDARKDWTLHLHPLRVSMFSNERTNHFFGLVHPQTKPESKTLQTSLVLHQNTSAVWWATFSPNSTHSTFHSHSHPHSSHSPSRLKIQRCMYRILEYS